MTPRLSLAAAAVLAAVRDGNVVPQAVGFEYRAACAEAERRGEALTLAVADMADGVVLRAAAEPARPVGAERPAWDATANVAAALDTDNEERRPTPREEIT